MGQVLDKPVVEKKYESGAGNGLKYAAIGMQGWRLDMEDAHSALPVLTESFGNVSYFAVFDGHAGNFTSTICAEKLHQEMVQTLQENGFTEIPAGMDQDTREKLSKTLADTFVRFDAGLRESEPYTSGRESCGTTALACLVTPDYVIFCNCGDSRGFLARNGEVLFQTKDHKPADTVERKRIEASGGSVIMDRVNGNLAVSRAIGDFSFKDKSELDLRDQAVSPEPTVTILDREQEEFIILACDGIWDVMTCERVRAFVNAKLKITENMYEIVSDLINACLILDSRDNMTCMIITFPGCPTISQSHVEAQSVYIEEIKMKLKEYVEKSGQSATVFGAYEFLTSQTFTESSASALGPILLISFIEQYLDEAEPNRCKEKDYSQTQGITTFPLSMSAIHRLVGKPVRERPDSQQNDTGDSKETSNYGETNPLDSLEIDDILSDESGENSF